ncbi:hypothetical protein [Falsiroseomonas sp. CW058]|uniref:hypothetical protein n=1 Tax=Falsiroseomonas sp. CW058 TaxID=3388664 RepID=UPI003D320BD4
MSLVETLVGLVLLGLLAWIGLSALGLAGRAGAAVAADPAAVSSVQEVLRLRLASALPVMLPAEGARPVPAFQGEPTRLRLVAELPPRFGVAGPALVEFAQDGSSLRMAWRPLHGAAAGEGARGRVLLDGVAAVALRYAGDPRGGHDLGWHAAWRDAAGLPLAVEFGVSFPSGDPRHWPPLVVAPRHAVPP